jgi:hypothetical protein
LVDTNFQYHTQIASAPNAQKGGTIVASDAAGTVHHPYVKVEFGASDTQTPVSSANPLPVDGAVTAELESNVMRISDVSVTPKFAIIDAALSGNNTIVAAVASKKLRVLAYTLIATGAVNVRWESGADGTALSGVMNLTTNSGMSPAFCPVGLFETAAGVLLNLELSGAVSVDGHLTYIEV